LERATFIDQFDSPTPANNTFTRQHLRLPQFVCPFVNWNQINLYTTPSSLAIR